MIKKLFCHSLLCLLTALLPAIAQAQIQDEVFQRPYLLSAGDRQCLRLNIDNLNFFQNNEFKGNVDKGYTLPGLWLQPRVSYQPLANLRLEAGVHLLYYSGAKHYPSGGYQGLPYWQDANESNGKGLHARPFFRAQLSGFDNKLNLVLGNLYGGANHRLIEPLYNPELNLSADPESGLQVLFNLPCFDLDAWIDWQNFIFRQDNQQEQFTLALSSRIKFKDSGWYIPVQLVAQHWGGEIQQGQYHGISSLLDAATGIGYNRTLNRPILKRFWANAHILCYKQLSGSHMPFENGYGLHATAGASLKGFCLQGGYLYANKFITLLGSPYFGTISADTENTLYPQSQMVYEKAEYTHSFGNVCSVGINVTLYHRLSGQGTDASGQTFTTRTSTSVLAGIYLRTSFSVLLARLSGKQQ